MMGWSRAAAVMGWAAGQLAPRSSLELAWQLVGAPAADVVHHGTARSHMAQRQSRLVDNSRNEGSSDPANLAAQLRSMGGQPGLRRRI